MCVALSSEVVLDASEGEGDVEYVIWERDLIACWSVERGSGKDMVVVGGQAATPVRNTDRALTDVDGGIGSSLPAKLER